MGRRKKDAPPTAEDFLRDKLLILVKDQPAIYDKKHPDHSNKHIISEIWYTIGLKLDIPAASAISKYDALRKEYSRQRALHPQPPSGSEGGEYAKLENKVSWHHWDAMKYLDKHISVRTKTTTNFGQSPLPPLPALNESVTAVPSPASSTAISSGSHASSASLIDASVFLDQSLYCNEEETRYTQKSSFTDTQASSHETSVEMRVRVTSPNKTSISLERLNQGIRQASHVLFDDCSGDEVEDETAGFCDPSIPAASKKTKWAFSNVPTCGISTPKHNTTNTPPTTTKRQPTPFRNRQRLISDESSQLQKSLAEALTGSTKIMSTFAESTKTQQPIACATGMWISAQIKKLPQLLRDNFEQDIMSFTLEKLKEYKSFSEDSGMD